MVLSDAQIITLDDTPMSPTPGECERCCRELKTAFKAEKVTPNSTAPPSPRFPETFPPDIGDYFADVDATMQAVYHQAEAAAVINNMQQLDINNNNIAAQYYVNDELEPIDNMVDNGLDDNSFPLLDEDDLRLLEETLHFEGFF